ncbi:MAG: hypothetical protein WBQ86_22290 [Candidatus Binatus sp.]
MSNRATFIGGGGACGAYGISTGIDSDAAYWNDCELHEEATHASRIEATTAAVEVRERLLILGRGIDSSSGRMVEYRLSTGAAQ